MSGTGPLERMSRERWLLLEPHIDAALDLAPDRRSAIYDEVASRRPELRADLERFVRRAEEGDALFSSTAAERFAALLDGELAPSLVADVLPQLQTSLGSTYTLERELGGGGMSRVFLAHELGLGRRVVIKVLTPERAAGINAERFDREIKLAATLQQANIVPLLATGRAGGHPYYTMPFVEGRSLRDRLTREGTLPIAEGVNLLRDVARALAYAHARGVVHRDIKPGNVLLSAGTAVVTDFGIAKAISAAKGGGDGPDTQGTPAVGAVEGSALSAVEGQDRSDSLTNAGSGIGTPPYMAPEQAAGDPTMDHRADIYAFGCLAYEVFTGSPPFQGDAADVIIAAHRHETPHPVTDRRIDVPRPIAGLIAQCLEKDPRRRPQSAADLLVRLDAASSEPAGWVRQRLPVTAVALVALAMAVGAGAYRAYRSAHIEAPNAAERLGLATIPFGTKNREAYRSYLEGQTLLKLRGSGVKRSVTSFEAAIALDPNFAQAHGALAKALTFFPWFYGVPESEVRDTVMHTAQRALALDSTLADAHGAIALVYASSAEWDKAVTEFRSALATEPANFDVHLDYARLLTFRGDVAEAMRQLKQARDLEPVSALAAAWMSYVYFLNDDRDSALKEIARAVRLDSTLSATTNLGALVSIGTGRTDEARRLIAAQVTTNPVSTAPYVYAKLGDTATAMGIVRHLESTTPRPWSVDVQRASVMLAIGDSAAALSALERSARTTGQMWTRLISVQDPAYDLVRHSPRFAALVTAAGLDAARVTAARR